MPSTFAKRTKSITSLILVASIVGLTLISCLPMATEVKTDGTIVYYTIDSIKTSNNNKIQGLERDIDLSVICFCILIIFSLLSHIGTILVTSEKYFVIAKVIMLTSCANILVSIFVVYLNFDLINYVKGTNGLSAPLISKNIAINYQYFILISAAISVIGSLLYVIFTAYFYLKRSPSKKKQFERKKGKSDTEKKFVKPNENDKIIQVKNRDLKEELIVRKSTFEQTKKESYEDYIQDDHADSEQYPLPKKVAVTKKEIDPEEMSFDLKEPAEKDLKNEIQEEVKQEEPTKSSEIQSSPLFEKALSSAIEKRYPNANKIEEPIKQSPPKKKLSIRCPECKNIFSVDKEEGVFETKIECPKCGRKGVIKQ